MKEKNFVSVVAYVRNDEQEIPAFASMIGNVLSDRFQQYEIIFVDDASTDGSVAAIRRAAANITGGTIQIVHMSYTEGLELSMEAGTVLAIGDYVYEFDTVAVDYDPAVVFSLYERSLAGNDVVSAAPKEGQQTSSELFYRIYNTFSQSEYSLRTETFRILSRRAINRIHTMSKTIPYRKAIYANCGLQEACIEYERQGDVARRMLTGRFRMAVDVLILFTDVGYCASFALAGAMMMFTIFVAFYALYMFASHQAITGWTSMILVISFGFAGLFGLGAILVKYLDILLGLVFKRRTYLVEGIEKLPRQNEVMVR